MSLTSNPSHLEAVDPVLEGMVRAKQDAINKHESGYTVLPVLLHGDAAFAGQGVVAETLNLSQLRGYRTGGTVHVVVNNQVGFTTSPSAGRSSVYATDVARMVQAPIFHVNGDDPEACVRVARLAFQFREVFRKDVVIDMVCYRRRGHSEVDEPSFTQPLMYDTIDSKRSVRKLYTESLIGRGDITLAEAEQALRNYQSHLERVFVETRDASMAPTPEPRMAAREVEQTTPDTAIPLETIKRILETLTNLPDGLHRASPAPAAAAPAGSDDRRREDRLGAGRDARLRGGAARRADRAPGRPGQPARHLRAPACRPHRPAHRRGVRPAALPRARPGRGRFLLRLRLAAERVRRARLRVRVLDRPPGCPGALGGPVRRLRQRCAVDHRRVRLGRRGEMGPAQRPGDAAAARLRGTGPGPLVRADRALAAAVRRGQPDGRVPVHSGPVLPPAAPPGGDRAAPAVRGLHPEIDVAAARLGLGDGGLHRRRLAGGARRSPGRPQGGDPGAAVRGQDLLRPRGGPEEARDHRRGPHPGRAALPDAHGGRRARPGRVPAPARPRLGAGRAREPGRVAAHGPHLARRLGGARARGRPARGPAAAPHLPAGGRLAGDRLHPRHEAEQAAVIDAAFEG